MISDPDAQPRTDWLFLLVICGAGFYLRTRGLGSWPLTTDEYFLYRSATFFAESGLPQFPCGGYYVRGLAVQALMVPLLWAGIDIELAARLIPVLASIVAICGAFALTNLVVGRPQSFAVAIVLALSVWHIEMARFARMYAPFQAVFVWYVFFLIKAIRTDAAAYRWAVLVLSVLAPLVWEGGIFVVLTSFAFFACRKTIQPYGFLAAHALVMMGAVVFQLTDFRLGAAFNTEPFVAPENPGDDGPLLVPRLMAVTDGPAAIIASVLLLLALAVIALRKRSTGDNADWHAWLSLAAVSVLLAFNQLVLAAFVAAIAGLVSWLPREEFVRLWRPGPVVILFVAAALIWGIYTPLVSGGSVFATIRALFDYPNILDSLVRPWLGALGAYAALLFVASGGAITIAIVGNVRCATDDKIRPMLAVLAASVAGIGVLATKFQTTRYGFFLYPLLLVATTYFLYRGASLAGLKKTQSSAIAAGLLMLMFVLSSDFRPRHAWYVNSYEINFRDGFSAADISHYYKRFDFFGAAEAIDTHAETDDIVITTLAEASLYVRSDFVYLDKNDARHFGQACNRQTKERWSDLPLLSSLDEVLALRESHTVWVLAGESSRLHNAWEDAVLSSPNAETRWLSPTNRLRLVRLPIATADSRN